MNAFEQTKIGSLVLGNRFVRSATAEGLATGKGHCSPALIKMMVRLAKGGVGLIITGHAAIRPDGVATIRQLGVWHDDQIPALVDMTDQVHEADGKIVMQLNHGGTSANMSLTNEAVMGPMLIEKKDATICREMSRPDIRSMVQAFAAAANRAKMAGFDGVQIHAAHGYLLSSFLSPYFNKRRDEYGGTVENRARFLLEVVRAVFSAVGDNFPVLVKINVNDFLLGGFSLTDMLETAVMLETAGIHAIELSGGTPESGKFNPPRRGKLFSEDEGYYKEDARHLKEKVYIPVILVGGIRSFRVAQSFLQEGICDYIAMSRPLIREPDLISRWQAGNSKASRCISDNQCYRPIRLGKGLYCLTKERDKPHK